MGLGVILHIPHAVFQDLLTSFLEMVPVGPGAAAVIAGIVTVSHATGIGPIIAYAIYAAALRLSIDQLVGPLALGTAARLHPAMIIFCFIVGWVLFGIRGRDHGGAGRDWDQDLLGGAVRRTARRSEAKPE
jgi:predicted PurR-regulated permease PerM